MPYRDLASYRRFETHLTTNWPIFSAKRNEALDHTFSTLAGLSTHIYQTVHDGALAFLVVVSPANVSRNTSERSKNNGLCAKSSVFTRRQ